MSSIRDRNIQGEKECVSSILEGMKISNIIDVFLNPRILYPIPTSQLFSGRHWEIYYEGLSWPSSHFYLAYDFNIHMKGLLVFCNKLTHYRTKRSRGLIETWLKLLCFEGPCLFHGARTYNKDHSKIYIRSYCSISLYTDVTLIVAHIQ